MTIRSRRSFLITATAGLAVTRANLAVPSPGQDRPTKTNDVDVRVTSPENRYAPAPPLRWRPASVKPAAEAVILEPGQAAQPILGFGAAFTDAACYVIGEMPEAAREALLQELFDPKQMGLSVCRICIGSSDYARKVYSYDEGEPDPELKRFSIDGDRAYILPIIRRVRAMNPELFLLGTPWSPPNWMKDNNSMLGGTIRRRYLDAYADYFVKFLQAYKDEGVFVNAVSAQNEVDTDQDSRMPACLFPQEIEVRFVGKCLGPALERAGIASKIWLIDHNYNLWGRAVAELDDPTVRRYSNAVAWHGYLGEPEWMKKVLTAHPEVEMYWTEGGPDYTDAGYLTDWAKWSRTFAGILRNGARCIMGWNIALDETGKPKVGPFDCGGLVTVQSKTKEVTRSGQYWAFAHYSRSMARGAVVVASHGGPEAVAHVAARNPDGGYALVLTNAAAAAQRIELRLGPLATEVSLLGDSVTTLKWA
ncbi:MAG TPA: glycoside hydrolase family 30 beta sandwich domain-containing protein [Vicinamibacteria bacterium]|nr:glycoside hydrolase family 30 beta sandwich domain-containing protein [Vicinamibacteria bacterium]